MSEANTITRPAPSLARIEECRLFLTYLVQQMRNAPPIIVHLDKDELRQLAKAAAKLHEDAQLALDIVVAHQAATEQGRAS